MRAPPPPKPPPWHGRLHTTGVTGTNGKTTTTWLIAQALARLARPVARTSTLGAYLDEEPVTVPKNFEGFLELMRRALQAGGRYAVIELTSESLALGFGRAWPSRVGVFTNLSEDHLQFHKSFEHYLASKAQLFLGLPRDGVAVLNADDPCSQLIAEVVPPGARVVRYSRAGADVELRARSTELSWDGSAIEFEARGLVPGAPDERGRLEIAAIGHAFAENALAALAAARVVGVSTRDACEAMAQATWPAGRFEVLSRRPGVVVDFAHTPDALRRMVNTARALCRGRLTVVFGAGGNRDRGKRAKMGAAARPADRVLLTTDNPRDEDPAAIAQAIRAGLEGHPGVELELDRRAAIKAAVSAAGEDDVVLIAGKGHERGQELAGRVRPFSDQEVVRELLGG